MRKDSVFNTETSFFNSWYKIRKGFEEFYKANKGDLNINPAEAAFLSQIYYKNGISQREIAQNLAVSEANIAKTFKKLDNKKLVYKTIDKENNARRNLYLTEDGEKAIERIMEIFYEFDKVLFAGLTAEEIEKMETQLKEIGDKSLKLTKSHKND